MTTVRGITSRVDIVWSSDGLESQRINGTKAMLSNNVSVMYTSTYTIPLLSTTDDGRVYQCEVVINTSPPVMATDNFTLDVIGLFTIIDIAILFKLILSFSSYSWCINGTIWVSRGSYGR